MAYILNVDMWHVVNPEDQKIHRLAKGDKVPDWAVDNEGVDLDTLTTGRFPVFVKDEEDVRASTGAPPAQELSAARSESPERPRDKK
jgi:hypothetical protein